MLSESLYNECKSLYLQGLSLSKISKLKNINRATLSKNLKQDNIEIRSKTNHLRKHFVIDEHYFDQIDSEEKAYILGFIYADGNNFPSKNRVSIKLSKSDEDILVKMSNIIYGKINLNYSSNKDFKYSTLLIHNKHISKTLLNHGVLSCKSKTITYPKWLDKNLHKHFIRGLIDGDGWIYIPSNNRYSPSVGLISTRNIIDYIKEYLLTELKIKSYITKANKQDINVMCELRIKNYKQCKILLEWLYKDSSIYLNRKYDLYIEIIKIHSTLRHQNR